MYLTFDENRREPLSDERRREISDNLLNKYRPAAAPPVKTIRPIEHLCRHCFQREPLGRSRYCGRCIEMSARIDREQNRNYPGALRLIAVGLLIFLVWWALSGWLEPAAPPNFQTPTIKTTSK